MKNQFVTAMALLALVSCEKPNQEVESKLKKLEQTAAEALERQQQLELELTQQKLMAERDAIERERAMLELERLNREDEALAVQEQKQRELMARESKLLDLEKNFDERNSQLKGLESQLSEKELELAGREPLGSLPLDESQTTNLRVGDFRHFYESLGSYGSWFHTSDYGYVYQPVVVRERSWRPYTRGRWVFTNHGWTWFSSEPFGWACYHYGRWALLKNIGWVWIPGNQWAPAWVTWRESPGYIGWAPLPPETLAWSTHSWNGSVDTMFSISTSWYSFVSYRHFGSYAQTHCLPISQNTLIYQHTTNITHYHTHRERIFVGGPSYRTVCERIGRRIPIHRLRMDGATDWRKRGTALSSKIENQEFVAVVPSTGSDSSQSLKPTRIGRDLGEVKVDRVQELPKEVREEFSQRRQKKENGTRADVNSDRDREKRSNRTEPSESKKSLVEIPGQKIEEIPEVVVPNQKENIVPEIRRRPVLTDERKIRPEKPNRNLTTRQNREIERTFPTVPQVESVESAAVKNEDLPPGVSRSNSDVAPSEQKILPLNQDIKTPDPGVKTEILLDQPDEIKPQVEEKDSSPRVKADDSANQEALLSKRREEEERIRAQEKLQHDKIQRDQIAKREEQESILREREERESARSQQMQADRQHVELQSQEQERALIQQEAMKKQQEEQIREEENRRQREEADRQQEQRARQQEELRRQQQEEALRQQEEAIRQKQEQIRQQQEAQRQEEEARRQQQEQIERARQQQEEAQRQQEEARRQQQEQMERARQQEEEAQRQQEEARRQQQEQMERARQQQEEAQRQQEETRRQQQEQMERVRQQQPEPSGL